MNARVSASLGLAICLAICGAALAQDEPPYRWTVRGETVETLESQFMPLVPLDQSSPDGVVAAYVALTDGRASAAPVRVAGRAAVDAAIRRSLEPFEAALLTPEARRALLQQLEAISNEPVRLQRTFGTTEIVGVERHGELAYVETLQTVTTRELLTAPNEWNDSEEQISRLFTCIAVDGGWFIERIARWAPDPQSPADNPTHAWIPELSPLTEFFATMMVTSMPEPPAPLPFDTPEGAALAVFDTLQLRSTQLERDALLLTMREITMAAGNLLAPSAAAEIWKLAGDVAEGLDTAKPHLERRQIKSVELGIDEAVITVEPSASRTPAPVVPGEAVIRVQKRGDVWQIAGAGYYLVSFFGSTYVDTPFVYALR